VNKVEAIGAVIELTPGQPVLFTTGYACRIAKHIADRDNHFYMTGSMGLVSSIGVGIALSTGRSTVVVDGDGSLLMNPAGLITAGSMPRLPLLHIVMDDASYASTGGQDTPGAAADFRGLARASGYHFAANAQRPAELSAILARLLSVPTGPALVHCVLSAEDPPVPPRVQVDLARHARRFGSWIRTEGSAQPNRTVTRG
jgi:sulfopyruvate decarboxylase subunit beta